MKKSPQGHVGQYHRILHFHYWNIRSTEKLLGKKKCFQNNYGFKFPNFKKNNLQIEEFREFKQNKISDTPRYIITKQVKSKG